MRRYARRVERTRRRTDMKTPICDFVENYKKSNPLRLHMPGHKGADYGNENDVTEIDGADVLYSAKGIILESERNATEIFGSGKTLYSCEGSSLCIRAMLFLARIYYEESRRNDKKPLILAARNVHKTFLSAVALLDFDVEWLYPDKEEGKTVSYVESGISAEDVEKKLESLRGEGRTPIAVYVTSPDYLGNLCDLKKIALACKKYGVISIVDNAHGAYLKFLRPSKHPLDCGIDMCCDSAHKTLPVLTGGAYLHLAESCPPSVLDNAERAMSLFASTSPSYLILQSLDKINPYLNSEFADKVGALSDKIAETKTELETIGFRSVGNEPLKITLYTRPYGYTGNEVNDYLKTKNIFCEFYDPDFIVFMLTPQLPSDCLFRLKTELENLRKRDALPEIAPPQTVKRRALSVREAVFAETEILPTEQCLGRIYADLNAACPPAVPIVACGEIIDENAIKSLTYYGTHFCRVLKTRHPSKLIEN